MTRHPQTLRVLDTGLRCGAENIALNRALLEAHQAGETPHTLRFLRFTPAALVGFHQDVAQELRVDYCQAHQIEIQRRITGGGAIYFDETQLGWELYLDKAFLGSADMTQIAERICVAAAQGISRLGIEAQFRPRNDIEVNGRKISGTGGAFDGNSIMYQGTLLLDFDIERMLKVLHIPAEKLADKAIASARERVVNLKELLGHLPSFAEVQGHLAHAFAEAFAVSLDWDNALNHQEQARFEAALAEIDNPEWVYQHTRPAAAHMLERIYKAKGGLLRAALQIDTQTACLKQVWITGDFFVKPQRLILDLEAFLKDTPLDQLPARIQTFFANNPAELLGLTPEDFIALLCTDKD